MTTHPNYPVTVINDRGESIGQKLRKDIDKSKDLYHSVFVIILTPDNQVVLSIIPERTDLPNLYVGQLGSTVATICRHGETTTEAAQRALAAEVKMVNIKPTDLHRLGDIFSTLPDGHDVYMSAYYVIAPIPEKYSRRDIRSLETLTLAQLDREIADGAASLVPTLAVIWRAYRSQLPA